MMEDREIRQERSVVVSARVDVVKLANVFCALNRNGYNARTMSTLVSYCAEIAYSVLRTNGLLTDEIDNIGKAWQLFEVNKLTTKTMKDKNLKKVNTAWGFENLRIGGNDPEYEQPMQYKILHNRNSVDVPDDVSELVNNEPKVYTYTPRSVSQEDVEIANRALARVKAEIAFKNSINDTQLPATESPPTTESPRPLRIRPGEHGTRVDMPREYLDEEGYIDHSKIEAAFRARQKASREKFEKLAEEKAARELLEQQQEKERLKELRKLEKYKAKIAEQEAKLGLASPNSCALDSTSKPKPSTGHSLVPRQKTNEELELDAKRLEDKDRAMLSALNAPAPKPPR